MPAGLGERPLLVCVQEIGPSLQKPPLPTPEWLLRTSQGRGGISLNSRVWVLLWDRSGVYRLAWWGILTQNPRFYTRSYTDPQTIAQAMRQLYCLIQLPPGSHSCTEPPGLWRYWLLQSVCLLSCPDPPFTQLTCS